jgi:hypothetical protein
MIPGSSEKIPGITSHLKKMILYASGGPAGANLLKRLPNMPFFACLVF